MTISKKKLKMVIWFKKHEKKIKETMEKMYKNNSLSQEQYETKLNNLNKIINEDKKSIDAFWDMHILKRKTMHGGRHKCMK